MNRLEKLLGALLVLALTNLPVWSALAGLPGLAAAGLALLLTVGFTAFNLMPMWRRDAFTRLGAMVGGGSILVMDVPPFVICNGNPAEPHGLNIVGLRRAGYDLKALNAFKAAYKVIYRDGLRIAEAVQALDVIIANNPQVSRELKLMRDFIASSERGIIRPKND